MFSTPPHKQTDPAKKPGQIQPEPSVAELNEVLMVLCEDVRQARISNNRPAEEAAEEGIELVAEKLYKIFRSQESAINTRIHSDCVSNYPF